MAGGAGAGKEMRKGFLYVKDVCLQGVSLPRHVGKKSGIMGKIQEFAKENKLF